MVTILSAFVLLFAFRFRSRAALELKLIALQHPSSDRAGEFSADGKTWTAFPSGIGGVTGRLSPWGTALVFEQLEKAPLHSVLDLSDYEEFVRRQPVRIALGASTVCARRQVAGSSPVRVRRVVVAIGWLKDPYAVWLR
jgi:hypothetical protein